MKSSRVRTLGPFVALISVVFLTGCAAGAPTGSATESPTATSTPSPAPTPVPTPTAEPVGQAFGGDCDAMLTASERAGAFGREEPRDPELDARRALFEEASIVEAGGLVCNWAFEETRLGIVVVPSALMPDEVISNDYPCSSGFRGCSWKLSMGEWWVNADVRPVDPDTWQDDPAPAEFAAGIVSQRAGLWGAPQAASSVVEAECEALAAIVNAAVPGAAIHQSGWGITGVQWISRSAGLVTGCPWNSGDGMADLLIQPEAGAPSPTDLVVLGAVNVGMPDGRAAHQVTVTPTYGFVIASSGTLRASISGPSAVTDPQRVAAIIAVVLDEMS